MLRVNTKIPTMSSKSSSFDLVQSALTYLSRDIFTWDFDLEYRDDTLRQGVLDYLSVLPTASRIEYNSKDQQWDFYDSDETLITFVKPTISPISLYRLEELLKKEDKDVISSLALKLPEELFNHLPSQIGSVLHKIALRPFVIEEISRQIQLLAKEDLPYLMFHNADGITPMDIAVSNS